mgnify:CR=1 FL=1
MAKRNKIPKVLFRHCDDMEHIIVSRNGVLLHDGYEGFPMLRADQVLECLAECGIIELEKEVITEV